MVIKISDIVAGADTAEQGAKVFALLHDALVEDQNVILSFAGIQTATSSFVSVALVALLNSYSLEEIKRRLRIIDSSRQINEMIKARLEKETLATA